MQVVNKIVIYSTCSLQYCTLYYIVLAQLFNMEKDTITNSSIYILCIAIVGGIWTNSVISFFFFLLHRSGTLRGICYQYKSPFKIISIMLIGAFEANRMESLMCIFFRFWPKYVLTTQTNIYLQTFRPSRIDQTAEYLFLADYIRKKVI